MAAASMDVLERRTDRLEELLAQLASSVARVSLNVDRLSLKVDRMADEMREHREQVKEEMREHREQVKEEMREHSQRYQRELREHREQVKEEMREHRERVDEDIRKYDEQSRREIAAMRQSIAEVSHKMGTMAEDLVAPSIPRILKQILRCDEQPAMLGVRIRKRLPDGRSQEYDVIAIVNDYLLVNETKSRLGPEDMPAFVQTLGAVRDFLPEYADKKIIGALASFYVDPTLVVHGTRHGIIMLGVTDGLMEPLQAEGFTPAEF